MILVFLGPCLILDLCIIYGFTCYDEALKSHLLNFFPLIRVLLHKDGAAIE